MRECVLCPGGGGLGNAATPPSSPPVVLELGFISEVAAPYKATLFWSGNVGMDASD